MSAAVHQHSLQFLAQPFRKRWKSLRRRSRVGGSGRPAVCTPSCCSCSSVKISKTNYLVCRWKPKPMLQLVPRSPWSTIAPASFVTSVQSLMFFLPVISSSSEVGQPVRTNAEVANLQYQCGSRKQMFTAQCNLLSLSILHGTFPNRNCL